MRTTTTHQTNTNSTESKAEIIDLITLHNDGNLESEAAIISIAQHLMVDFKVSFDRKYSEILAFTYPWGHRCAPMETYETLCSGWFPISSINVMKRGGAKRRTDYLTFLRYYMITDVSDVRNAKKFLRLLIDDFKII